MNRKSKAKWTVSSFSEAEVGETSKNVKTTKVKKEKKPVIHSAKYLNNYEPQTLADLALTNIRIKPLVAWFTSLQYQEKKGRILLLTGPDGSAKTAAIRVMAKERQMGIIDWVLQDIIPDCNVISKPYVNDDLNAFHEFLLRAGRYPQLDNSSFKKIVVVEDLPQSITSHKDEFYSILREYAASAKMPMVIISSHTDPNHLLNMDLKIQLNIETILFKMVPEGCIKKALNRVVLIHKLPTSKFTTVINLITETCGGNIRKAISELQIYIFKGKKGSSDRSKLQPLGDRKLSLAKLDKIKQETGIFHSVGRVLYAKRHTPSSEASTSQSRSKLLHNPMDIVDQYLHANKQFIHLLHNNYLDIFSSMESIAQASEYLSQSDIITSEWREKEDLEEVGFALAVGGMMDSCHNPVTKWKPITSSGWIQERNSISKINENVRALYPDLRSLSVEYNTDFLPIFNILCKLHRIPVKKCKFQFSSHEESDLISQIYTWRNRKDLIKKIKLGYEDDDDDLTIEDSE